MVANFLLLFCLCISYIRSFCKSGDMKNEIETSQHAALLACEQIFCFFLAFVGLSICPLSLPRFLKNFWNDFFVPHWSMLLSAPFKSFSYVDTCYSLSFRLNKQGATQCPTQGHCNGRHKYSFKAFIYTGTFAKLVKGTLFAVFHCLSCIFLTADLVHMMHCQILSQ